MAWGSARCLPINSLSFEQALLHRFQMPGLIALGKAYAAVTFLNILKMENQISKKQKQKKAKTLKDDESLFLTYTKSVISQLLGSCPPCGDSVKFLWLGASPPEKPPHSPKGKRELEACTPASAALACWCSTLLSYTGHCVELTVLGDWEVRCPRSPGAEEVGTAERKWHLPRRHWWKAHPLSNPYRNVISLKA